MKIIAKKFKLPKKTKKFILMEGFTITTKVSSDVSTGDMVASYNTVDEKARFIGTALEDAHEGFLCPVLIKTNEIYEEDDNKDNC